jgi:hypothetical protein
METSCYSHRTYVDELVTGVDMRLDSHTWVVVCDIPCSKLDNTWYTYTTTPVPARLFQNNELQNPRNTCQKKKKKDAHLALLYNPQNGINSHPQKPEGPKQLIEQGMTSECP